MRDAHCQNTAFFFTSSNKCVIFRLPLRARCSREIENSAWTICVNLNCRLQYHQNYNQYILQLNSKLCESIFFVHLLTATLYWWTINSIFCLLFQQATNNWFFFSTKFGYIFGPSLIEQLSGGWWQWHRSLAFCFSLSCGDARGRWHFDAIKCIHFLSKCRTAWASVIGRRIFFRVKCPDWVSDGNSFEIAMKWMFWQITDSPIWRFIFDRNWARNREKTIVNRVLGTLQQKLRHFWRTQMMTFSHARPRGNRSLCLCLWCYAEKSARSRPFYRYHREYGRQHWRECNRLSLCADQFVPST